MNYLTIIVKLILGLGIINVWFFRFKRPSKWRGANTNSMLEEFRAYGLPKAMMYAVGTVKVSLALIILASLFFKSLAVWGASGLAAMMAGAIAMHMRIGDPLKKSIPAISLLALSLLLVFLS